MCVYVYSHLLAVHNLLSRCGNFVFDDVCVWYCKDVPVHIVKMSHLLAILCLTMCVLPSFGSAYCQDVSSFGTFVFVCVHVCVFNVLQRCVHLRRCLCLCLRILL